LFIDESAGDFPRNASVQNADKNNGSQKNRESEDRGMASASVYHAVPLRVFSLLFIRWTVQDANIPSCRFEQ